MFREAISAVCLLAPGQREITFWSVFRASANAASSVSTESESSVDPYCLTHVVENLPEGIMDTPYPLQPSFGSGRAVAAGQQYLRTSRHKTSEGHVIQLDIGP